ncbi:MAG: hypothetical protein AB1345_08510 [Chloroflexota bacterium]
MNKTFFLISSRTSNRKLRLLLIIITLPALISVSCTLSFLELPTSIPGLSVPTATQPLPPTATPLPHAEITFQVEIPEDTPAGYAITLDVLDEVTGLAINPTRFSMEAIDPRHYAIVIPFPVNGVVKYRYTRQGANPAQEYTALGAPVRYRLYYVDGVGEVHDKISRWSDTSYQGSTGSIFGQVSDSLTGQPLNNVLVVADGIQTFSSSEGYFQLKGISPGTHTIVAYTLDGSYKPFRQEAIVASGAATPATLRMQAAPLVNIVFTVQIPSGTTPGVPIRMAGNLYQLGNTFADLNGGLSTIASRMPVLSPLPDGRYTITLALYAGTHLRYKYTLGDGLWNSEHSKEGMFKLRELVVPEANTLIEDYIESWQAGDSAPIWFDLTVPDNTPSTDFISIQFRPGAWTEPLPMWPAGANRWLYQLLSPLDMLGTFGYRYCRNDQCGVADDVVTRDPNTTGRPVASSIILQTLDDEISEWFLYTPSGAQTTIQAGNIITRDSFIAGIELQPYYHPSWLNRMPLILNTLRNQGANQIILTPTWTYTNQNPLTFQLQPTHDPLAADLVYIISRSQAVGLQTTLFPQAYFPADMGSWWQTSPRDAAWWDEWFASYRTFIIHFANIAAKQNVGSLILGGDWLAPALPGGTLQDGSPSGVPADAANRWSQIIQEVRTRFNGTLSWALSYPEDIEQPLPFLDKIDEIYLLWSARLASNTNATIGEMTEEAGRLLDSDVLPFLSQVNKPLVLAIAYPSADGGITGCLPSPFGPCLNLEMLSPPNPDIPNIHLDLQEQAEAYNAMLMAVNSRDWIRGFISRGYYPPAILQDKSTSIHGKPAAEVISYWYPRILGTVP